MTSSTVMRPFGTFGPFVFAVIGLLAFSANAMGENNADHSSESLDMDLLPVQADTNPPAPAPLNLRDLDGDGLEDFWEIFVFGTDPCRQDSDFDGIDDDEEILGGTDPNNAGSPASFPALPPLPTMRWSPAFAPATPASSDLGYSPSFFVSEFLD